MKEKRLFPHRRAGEDAAPQHSGRVVYRDRCCIVRRLWRWSVDHLTDAEESGQIYAHLPGQNGAGKARYASMDGHCLSALSFDRSDPFRSGFARVGLQGQGYGYLDRDLNLTIAPRYEQANPFSGGMASARRDGRWYLIDRQGNETPLDPAYRRVEPFCEGLCRASTMELDRLDLAYYEEHWPIAGLWGYVDTSGREIAAPQYIFAHDFDGGIAIAAKGEWTQDERWDNQYRQNGWWSEEIRWGGIDTHGREVIPFVFDDIDFFFDRTDCFLAHAGDWDGGHWGVIDRQGRVVLPCEYDVPPLGFCHKTQRFIFRQGGKYGVKDYSGHTVWPAVYDRIRSLDAPFPVLGHKDREWPVTARGKPILPNTYESVHWFSDKRHFCTHRDGICEMYVVQER